MRAPLSSVYGWPFPFGIAGLRRQAPGAAALEPRPRGRGVCRCADTHAVSCAPFRPAFKPLRSLICRTAARQPCSVACKAFVGLDAGVAGKPLTEKGNEMEKAKGAGILDDAATTLLIGSWGSLTTFQSYARRDLLEFIKVRCKF
jgi:hypothetical protein